MIILVDIYNSNIETGKLEKVTEIKKGCWINLENPTEEEIQRICKEVNIEQDFIRYALDYEENSKYLKLRVS